ncbi:SWIM zinc finger family protein [Roseburia faecis]
MESSLDFASCSCRFFQKIRLRNDSVSNGHALCSHRYSR